MLMCAAAPFGVAAQPPAPPAAGPIRVSDQFLLNTGLLTFEPPPLEVTERGAWQVELSLAAANTFVRSDSIQFALENRGERGPIDRAFLEKVVRESLLGEPLFLVDGELVTTRLRFRRGLGRGAEIELTLPFHTLHGGGFDSLVEGFHGALGVDQDGRQSALRDRFLLFLQANQGELLVQESPGTRLGDLTLAVRKALPLPRRSLRLLVDGELKLPIEESDSWMSSGSADAMLQALLSRCNRTRCIHGGLGLRLLGDWPALGLGEQIVPSLLGGFDLRLGATMSLAAQLEFSRSPYRDLGLAALAADSFRLAVGWKKNLPGGRTLSVALVENLLHFENGSDVELHVGLTAHLGQLRMP